MEIRKLAPADAEAYFDLRLEALRTNPEAFSTTYEDAKKTAADQYRERFTAPHTPTFGAFENDRLIGNVTLMKETAPKLAHRATVLAMYVTPEARGRGVAQQLLDALTEEAEAMGAEQLYLTVVSTNAPAKSLYERNGFRVFGLDRHAMKEDDRYIDEEWMIKFLYDFQELGECRG